MLGLISWWIFFHLYTLCNVFPSLWLCAHFWEGLFWTHLNKFSLSQDLHLLRCVPRIVLFIKDIISSEGFFGLLEYFVVLNTFKLALNIVPSVCLVAEIGQELAFVILESFKSSISVYKIGIGIQIN